jgi:hypothetical protein
MKNGFFWDVTLYGPCKNRRFGGSPVLVALVKEALSSYETSVLTRAAWRNIPEDTILHKVLITFEKEVSNNIGIC